MKKKSFIACILTCCLLAMFISAAWSAKPAYAEQKLVCDFRSGIMLGTKCMKTYNSRHFDKGDCLHVVATSTCAFLIGVCYLPDSSNTVVSCVGACNKYITIRKSGYYRVFLYNNHTSKGTVKGGVYMVK